MKIILSAFADEASRDFDGQLAALRENGIGFIEMRNADGKNVSSLTVDEAKKYREKCDANGVRVWAIGSPLGKAYAGTDMSEYLKKAEHVCKVAEILGTNNIRAFSFYALSKKLQHEKVMYAVGELMKVFAANNMLYCHENEKNIYGDTAERVDELLDRFPEMRFVYDPANFIQTKQPAEKTLKKLADKAYYFHVKDVLGKSKVVPAGLGDGRLGDLVSLERGDTVFSVEPHLALFRGCKGFEKSGFAAKCDISTRRGRFDCAVTAFKKVLSDNGYTEKEGCFEK